MNQQTIAALKQGVATDDVEVVADLLIDKDGLLKKLLADDECALKNAFDSVQSSEMADLSSGSG